MLDVVLLCGLVLIVSLIYIGSLNSECVFDDWSVIQTCEEYFADEQEKLT